MDIFIRNIPESAGEGQLKHFFRHRLEALNCHAFEIEKFKNRTCAVLTVPTTAIGLQFLASHGVPDRARRSITPRIPLLVSGRSILCSKSTSEPDSFRIQSVLQDHLEYQGKSIKVTKKPNSEKAEAKFPVRRLYCGYWELQNSSKFQFCSTYEDPRQGSIHFGKRTLVILLDRNTSANERTRVDISYSTINSIAFGNIEEPSVTFTLLEAPRFSRLDGDLFDSFSRLSLNKTIPGPVRIPALTYQHAIAASGCLVYRIGLFEVPALELIKRFLKQTPSSPPYLSWSTAKCAPAQPFEEQIRDLIDDLALLKISFKIKFQLQRLAFNGFISPASVRHLLVPISQASQNYSEAAMVTAIQATSHNLPYAGPDIDPHLLSLSSIMDSIVATARMFRYAGSIFYHAKRHAHLGLIHKVFITPAGLYLEGPELETKNRVIRKYPGMTDHFIRVSFTDENLDNLHFHPSPHEIYRERFRRFSSSSLKSRQSWFMAPFVIDGITVHAERIIKDLGDFSKIRSPAKCAARIGQAFSDTTHTIAIHPSEIHRGDDIERNDRVFTDGCGSISSELLRRVWSTFASTNKAKATILQIRFQGAKGVLALDTRLPGNQIMLRPSMTKFEGSPDFDLEICGAAYRPLPCFLNRQFIKLLEDLEVPPSKFLHLQEVAIDELKSILKSPINAAKVMDVEHFGTTARVPSLIRRLHYIGVDFRDDLFLRSMVEMLAVTRMRQMKYRGRIPLQNAFLLYGVVDETGFLPENHVYVVVKVDGERQVLQGELVVTRAPALHPGDIQIVTAVDAPEGSSLRHLHNCIVFSQHGSRDLPSMLGGGDLDGDCFHVIFEPSLWPKKTYPPADYPRPQPIDIRREVTTSDIMDFLIDFFETDQLGHISTCHLQVADQAANGTLSDACITLAEMASTAVDYAKTGIAVDMTKKPRHSRFKPDFMAPAPRLLRNVAKSFEAASLPGRSGADGCHADGGGDGDDGDDDAVSALDPDARATKYYKSNKALGLLYRQIDEERFVSDLRATVPAVESNSMKSMLKVTWDHIKAQMQAFEYKHYRPLASEIRRTYYDNIVGTAFTFSPDLQVPLSELEVFAGVILGRDGGIQSKRVRESNISMRDKNSRDVAFTIEHILKGDPDHAESAPLSEDDSVTGEALERSVACLAVAMEEPIEPVARFGIPQSFQYVALAVCLEQLERRFSGLQPL